MKGKFLSLLLLTLVGAILAGGCQKEPEAVQEDGIVHVKSKTDDQIQDIVNENKDTQKKKEEKDNGQIDCKLGTKENGIRINAKLPKLPRKAYELILKPNERMNKDMLVALLGSDSQHVKDITKKIMEGSEVESGEEEGEDKLVEFPGFQDDSILFLTDEKRQAGFLGRTGIKYEDTELMKKCNKAAKTGKETRMFSYHSWEKKEKKELDFSLQDAQKRLQEKLAVVEIEEIHIFEATLYENNDFMFYEICFTPSYQEIGVAHEFGGIESGEAQPYGCAWITKEGVVFLDCSDFCGTIAQKSEQTNLLSFSQIEKILETYLNNNTISGSWKITMSNIEFLYYPIFMQKENSLKLTPVWNICIPLEQQLNQQIEDDIYSKATCNIYINAITGKIEEAK
ncbi:MAG: hypothetical protein K2N51_06180 [Lachnospiraceae bacterium]|nr:hypothetical protein [Lachnospiraceae bacterium]